MAITTVCEFYKTRDGLAPEMGTVVAAEAIKRGDPITPTAANLGTADRIDDAAEKVLGVAAGDAASGADCLYYVANYNNLFIIPCVDVAGDCYDDSDDKYTTCDFVDFTTGAMGIDCTTDVSHQVQLLGLAPGETDDTHGNKVIAFFALRSVG